MPPPTATTAHTMDAGSLSKLNISQLKLKCKDYKITGYSRLSKTGLINKLVAFAPTSTSEASLLPAAQAEASPSIIPQASDQPAPQAHTSYLLQEAEDPPPAVMQNGSEPAKKIAKKRHKKDTHKPVARYQSATGQSRQKSPPEDANVTLQPPCALLESQATFQVPRLPGRLTQAIDGSTGPSFASTVISLAQNQAAHSQGTFSSDTRPAPNKCEILGESPEPRLSTKPANTAAEQSGESPKTKSARPQTYKPKSFKAPAVLKSPRTVHSSNTLRPIPPLPCCSDTNPNLDFALPPTHESVAFPRISMPPSMSRRRQAERMSVVFSGINNSSVLAICVRVSRAWRYAVYLSATHTLIRDFPGKRTSAVISVVQEPRMTNTWTYLRARRQEMDSRRQMFGQTWLGRFMQKANIAPVSARMWTCPDDPRQIMLVLRFVSTRLVFALARRYEHNDAWTKEAVVGAEEVVPDEIWKVTTKAQGEEKTESFYVLFDTGEVIGHAPQCRNPGILFGQRVARGRGHLEIFDEPRGNGIVLRNDWARYIDSIERGDVPSLQDAITSVDQEFYVSGISSFWLRGLGGSNPLLRTIATRYVLACVEPNSVSGDYKSVVSMARRLAGGEFVEQTPTTMKAQRVGLLVSEHHLVESVHLEHLQPRPNSRLHPALALVLTAPGREYFVLRDTGMPVGTNDEGLEKVWQEIVGCDAWGCVSA
ncbi:SAP domain protein [Ceratobasidium sp. AG-Ba]|nr:SAP domain protein [Ceratobasidium sp. AG-Ba]QRW09102.1 SAP domain protein [Ceratobasidium sp. AG-Ba]